MSAVPSTLEDIRRAYDEHASLYARCEPVLEVLGLSRVRRRLLHQAEGDVLEVAVGTGANLKHYPPGCRITAIDVSKGMLEYARKHAEKQELDVVFRRMDAEHMDFPTDRFDTVVSTMTLCTFIHPVEVLSEMQRVCRPDGRILLMEHGRSRVGWIARWQDRREHKHAEQLGCHWNREPLEIVEEADLNVVSAQRHFFGIFHEIVTHPTPAHQTE